MNRPKIIFILCCTSVIASTGPAYPSEVVGKKTVLNIYAQSYTPEIATGDNPKPLHEFTRLAREWEALHPGVRVRFVRTPVGDFRTWMITQLKGGMAPDIMWAHAGWCNEDAKYNWFVPLNSYLDKPNKYVPGNDRWGDIFYKDATNMLRAPDGSLYVLPIDQVEIGIFYNKDIFRKAGVRPPKTWEELMLISKKIQSAGYVPFLCNAQDDLRISWWSKATLHDQLWNDKLPDIDVRDVKYGFPGVDQQEFVRAYKKGLWSVRDPRYRETLRILKGWSRYWNKDALSTNNDRLFRIGKAAMIYEGCWYTARLKRDPLRQFEFGVFPFPMLTKATSRYAPGIEARGHGGAVSTQYGITNSSVRDGKVDLAVDFLQFITAPENMGPLINEAEINLPNSPGLEVSPLMEPFRELLERPRLKFVGEAYEAEYYEQSHRVIQSYIGGKYTLDQAIDHLDRFVMESVDRLIERNPRWHFADDWDILPDKPENGIIGTRRSPALVRYIPWALLGAFVLAAVTGVAGNRNEFRRRFRQKKHIYVFIIPSILLLAVFNYYPVFSAFYHSLFDWEGGGKSVWVGTANFRQLLDDTILRESVGNALRLLLFGIVISVTVPLAAAELVFHLRSQLAQYVYRVLFVIPMVVPGVVILLIWGFIYDYNIGVLNQILRAVGLGEHAQVWLGDPRIALYSLMFMGFPWVGGFGLLIYYAGLQNIPQDVLDSCRIDGATGLTRIRRVDIPLLLGQIKLLIVLGFIGGIQGFQTQLLLTQGGPGYSTMVPGLHLYQNAIKYDRMGYACAIGVALFLTVLGLTYINMRFIRSGVDHGAG